nr:protein of unknown function (DUF3168) [uncultured bacterium]
MLPPIYTWLKASNAVKAIIGNTPRAYRPGDAPQDVTQPYVTWALVAGVPDNQLSSTPPSDRYTVQVDCWHTTDKGVEDLAKAVRNAIEPNAHLTAIPVNNRDPETKLYRIALQFDVLQTR